MVNFMLSANIRILAVGLASVAVFGVADAAEAISWYDAKTLTFEGQGWSDTPALYDRLPARVESKVFGYTWQMSKDSAGMVVRFVTNSSLIAARWKLAKEQFALPHMPASGVSGVDLYVKHNGEWQWLGAYNPQQPMNQQNEQVLFSGLSSEDREYSLYFPLYNGVSAVEVGIADESTIKPAPPRKHNIKPVVFYGSSIVQGGCASRPGMAYPSIIGRKLDIPIINLGFSGEGKCEHEFSDILAELDPSVFVIDCLPNMATEWIDDRLHYLLKVLKEKHPDTPVVLVEDVVRQNIITREASSRTDHAVALEKVYNDCKKDWGNRLFYVKGDNLLGSDGQATVDGLHPTDVGFLKMADGIAPTVKKALGI